MNVIDLNTRVELLEVPDFDDKPTLQTHKGLLDPTQHIARVLFYRDSELAAAAPTRGEAMLQLGEYLKAVGFALVRKAFEQEGAVRLP